MLRRDRDAFFYMEVASIFGWDRPHCTWSSALAMRIAIDAGHGPDTPGKRTPDGAMREYAFNAAVADAVCSMLDVDTVRVDDPTCDVPLVARVAMAHQAQATCYMSIHANAVGTTWNDAQGIETFVSPSAPEGGQALVLARAVQKHLVAVTKRRDRGVKRGDLYVLRHTRMPSCLVECGFMTHRDEAALLQSDAYRHQCARAIVLALKEVYGVNTTTNTPQWAIDARAWAMAQGLTDGSDPKGTVTREQMWAMLQRFAKMQERKDG
jgi:N-acetylmuramoyl-L-alanine amidase